MVVVSDIAGKVFSEKPIAKMSQYIWNHVKIHDLLGGQNKYRICAIRLLFRFDLNRTLVVDHGRIPLGIVAIRDMVLRNVSDIEAE